MTKKLDGRLKNLYRKMIFGKVLIVLYIVLPMLLVATGFSAWVINTPSFSADFLGTTTSSAVIDTSALMNVTKFEPVEELYYTGPVSGNNVQKQLNIGTEIKINPNKVATLAKESSNTMYLKLTLMLKTNEVNEAIFNNFTYTFANFKTDDVEVVAMPTTAKSLGSTYSVVFKMSFTEGASFTDAFDLIMTPSFILSADGYQAFYDYCIEQSKLQIQDRNHFVLDLRLSESNNI